MKIPNYTGMCILCGGATFRNKCVSCKKENTGDLKNSKYVVNIVHNDSCDTCKKNTCEGCEE